MPERITAACASLVAMRHPFRALPPRVRLGFAGILGVLSFIVHRRQRVNAKTPAAPHGTLSLALTGEPRKANRIRTSWSRSTEKAVERNLRLDTLFSMLWTNAITLAGLWSADRMAARRWPTAKAGDMLAWAQWGAALLALTKDLEKRAALHGRTNEVLEQIGRWAAISELMAKSIGIVYAASPVLAELIKWRRRPRHVVG